MMADLELLSLYEKFENGANFRSAIWSNKYEKLLNSDQRDLTVVPLREYGLG